MPKGIIYVETMPASPDREAEYHKWYNDTHLEQILTVDGIVSARRFAPTSGDGPFIAIYELDCDDLDGAARQMGGLALTGLGNIAMDPKPIPHVYREIGSLGP
jgi:hypothetical protein